MDSVVFELLVILAAGLIAGILAKRFGFSMLVAYLLAGAAIGHGGVGLVTEDSHEIEMLAQAGALLLLFAIGIEFSLEELVRLSRYLFLGGSVQMLLVAVPVGVVGGLGGDSWRSAFLIASATALSSTVLVFRALAEWGQTTSPHGRRAIAILLFQDIALVPLILLVPLLTGREETVPVTAYLLLVLNSVLFVAAVLVTRRALSRWVVPLLSYLRSVELVILFGLVVLVGFCLGARAAGLPPALGAFAAGLALSGNRLTGQIDALILPYRESFAAVFFVSLGTLLEPTILLEKPIFLLGAMLAVLAVKTAGATVALRVTGLGWPSAFGLGLGLAQLGEFSFVLLSEGLHAGVIGRESYNQMLFIAIGTLVLTPQMLQWGLRWSQRHTPLGGEPRHTPGKAPPMPREAMVIGLGPIGRQAASRLELMGIDVCLIDLSPVNLHPYAQQGFRTVAGDACDVAVLDHADAAGARLAVVCVPNDREAIQIVKTLRQLNPSCTLLVRCRYQENVRVLRKAGAHTVVSEEAEASTALLRHLEGLAAAGGTVNP